MHLIAQKRFDLVLTDLNLTGMTGIQLLTEILRTDPTVAVVLITGYPSIESAIEATKRGVYQYLEKPVDRSRLLEVLGGGGAGEVPRDPDDPYVRAIVGGRVTAPLVGGCLWLLLQTLGTPWEVELDGCIFFFEDVDAPAWYVEGMLTQLQQAGKLDGVAGVVVGDMHDCDWNERRPGTTPPAPICSPPPSGARPPPKYACETSAATTRKRTPRNGRARFR